jgi:hypothetical protein
VSFPEARINPSEETPEKDYQRGFAEGKHVAWRVLDIGDPKGTKQILGSRLPDVIPMNENRRHKWLMGYSHGIAQVTDNWPDIKDELSMRYA